MDYPEIYAVDFDKTLNLADTYPELGEPNMELIEFHLAPEPTSNMEPIEFDLAPEPTSKKDVQSLTREVASMHAGCPGQGRADPA